MQRTARLLLASALLAAAVPSCTDHPAGPSQPQIEGTYVATQFLLITSDTIFDELADGLNLTITLNRNRTTTGALTVLDAGLDLAGRWDTAGGLLHLQTTTPTFLTRGSMVVGPDNFQGDFTLEGGTVHLTLGR